MKSARSSALPPTSSPRMKRVASSVSVYLTKSEVAELRRNKKRISDLARKAFSSMNLKGK
ncbi:hypothetical protein D9M68_831650 [compost metagenome]